MNIKVIFEIQGLFESIVGEIKTKSAYYSWSVGAPLTAHRMAGRWPRRGTEASLPAELRGRPMLIWIRPIPETKILDFRGFDPSRILDTRDGILMPIGDFPESWSQNLSRDNLSREIGHTTSRYSVTMTRHDAVRCRAGSRDSPTLLVMLPLPKCDYDTIISIMCIVRMLCSIDIL